MYDNDSQTSSTAIEKTRPHRVRNFLHACALAYVATYEARTRTGVMVDPSARLRWMTIA